MKRRIVASLAGYLLLLAACDGPRPDPPREVYLDVRYAALGWSPDRSTWYFVKELREKRGYTWVRDWLDGSRWWPEVTRSRAIVCAVGADGESLRELYEIPDAPAVTGWHYTAMHSTGVNADPAVVLADENTVYRLDSDGTRRIGRLPEEIRQFDLAPNGSRVAAGDGETGLYLVELETGRRTRISRGRDRHPRWSPDGERLFFLRWADDGTAGLMLFEQETGEVREALRKVMQRGLHHDDVTWHEPSTIRIGNAYVADSWPLEEGLSVLPLGAPGCAVEEDRAVISTSDCAARQPGSYGLFGRMGPAGVFGVDNVAGTVRLLVVEDFQPVSFDSRWPRAVSEPSRCRVRHRFCLDGETITISSDERWDQEIETHRSPDGNFW